MAKARKPIPPTQVLRPKRYEDKGKSEDDPGGTGVQTERVERKLDQLEAEGVVLNDHAGGVLRHMLEQKFMDDVKLGFGTPSRQTMDRAIRRRRS